MAQDVWTRFVHDYLPTLRQWRSKGGSLPEAPRVGEIVLLKTALIPRLRWPIAKVIESRPHECVLQHNNRIITRAPEHVYRLEAEPMQDHYVTRYGRVCREPIRYTP